MASVSCTKDEPGDTHQSVSRRLQLAVKTGSFKEVHTILCLLQRPDIHPWVDISFYSNCLVDATVWGHKQIVELLLEGEMKKQISRCVANVAVVVAVENGFYDIVNLLLCHGACVNTLNNRGDSILMRAVDKSHSTEMIKLLLKAKADTNFQNSDGKTAAHICMEKHDFKTLSLLIDHNADLKLEDKAGCSVLKIASDHEVLHIVQLLIECKDSGSHLFKAVEQNSVELTRFLLETSFSDVNCQNQSIGQSALSVALSKGRDKGWNSEYVVNPEIVKLLVKFGADTNERSVMPPLCLACASGRIEIIQALLTPRTDVNIQDQDHGMTPLMYAVRFGHRNVIHTLVSAGADINKPKHGPMTGRMDMAEQAYKALTFAISKGDLESVKALLELGASVDRTLDIRATFEKDADEILRLLLQQVHVSEIEPYMLCDAVHQDSYKVVALLLDRGMNVNAQHLSGRTALMKAKSKRMAGFLIRKGAGVNLRDPGGITPLMHFSSRAHDEHSYCKSHHQQRILCNKEEIIGVLLRNGADVNASTSDGYTALMMTASHNMTFAAQLLISAGADVNKATNKSETALMSSIMQESTLMCEILLCNGAFVDAREGVGDKNTALISASQRGYVGLVHVLLENKANVNIHNRKGNTALHMATRLPVANLLLCYGADVNKPNFKGKTPIMFAAKSGSGAMVEFLISRGADVCAVSRSHPVSALSLVTQSAVLQEVHFSKICTLLDAGGGNVCPLHCDVTIIKAILYNRRHVVWKCVTRGIAPATICIRCLGVQKCFTSSFCCRLRNFTSLSPVDVALICGNTEIANYFHENKYLVMSDLFKAKRALKKLKFLLKELRRTESLSYLERTLSKTSPLADLSFVATSNLIGASSGRSERVASSGLPPVFQRRLLFRGVESLAESSSADHIRYMTNVKRIIFSPRYRFASLSSHSSHSSESSYSESDSE